MNNPNNSPASDPSGLTLPKNAPPAFHILSKPTGAICNLDCKYCFFLSKEMLYPGSRFRMADELLETYISQLLESSPDSGGYYRLAGRRTDVDGFGVSSNVGASTPTSTSGRTSGSNIRCRPTAPNSTTSWCAFFKKNNFLVGLSVDGPKEIHDAYRVNKGGEGTFDQVMRGLDNLKKHKSISTSCARSTPPMQNHPLELYHFFRDELGAQYHPVHPDRRARQRRDAADRQPGLERASRRRPAALHHEGSLVTERSVQAEQYRAISHGHLRRMGAPRRRQSLSSSISTAALANWVGVPGLCIFAETCGKALALEHNGDLYSLRPLRRAGLSCWATSSRAT